VLARRQETYVRRVREDQLLAVKEPMQQQRWMFALTGIPPTLMGFVNAMSAALARAVLRLKAIN